MRRGRRSRSKAVGDGRPDAELRLGEQFLDRLGQHVRRGVPDDAAALVGVGGHRGDLDVAARGPAQVAQFPLVVADHHDRCGFAAAGQTSLPDGWQLRGGPGRDPQEVDGVGCAGALIEYLFPGSRHGRRIGGNRANAIERASAAEPDGAAQHRVLEPHQAGAPVDRPQEPQRGNHHRGGENRAEPWNQDGWRRNQAIAVL